MTLGGGCAFPYLANRPKALASATIWRHFCPKTNLPRTSALERCVTFPATPRTPQYKQRPFSPRRRDAFASFAIASPLAAPLPGAYTSKRTLKIKWATSDTKTLGQEERHSPPHGQTMPKSNSLSEGSEGQREKKGQGRAKQTMVLAKVVNNAGRAKGHKRLCQQSSPRQVIVICKSSSWESTSHVEGNLKQTHGAQSSR